MKQKLKTDIEFTFEGLSEEELPNLVFTPQKKKKKLSKIVINEKKNGRKPNTKLF